MSKGWCYRFLNIALVELERKTMKCCHDGKGKRTKCSLFGTKALDMSTLQRLPGSKRNQCLLENQLKDIHNHQIWFLAKYYSSQF